MARNEAADRCRSSKGDSMRAMGKVLRSRPFAALAGATLAFALAGAVIASGSSPPLQVCRPGKEGKPLLTPKGGACKAGYTLVTVGAEGPQGEQGPRGETGPPGSSVVTRVHLAEPFVTAETSGSATLTGATWMQAAEEVEQLVGRMTVNRPSRAECGGAEGSPGKFVAYVKLDGSEVSKVSLLNTTAGATTVMLEWAGGESPTESTQWLFEPVAATPHTIVIEAEDVCGAHKAKHFVIESVTIDAIGIG